MYYAKQYIQEQIYSKINHYPDRKGYFPLRTHLKNYLHETRGIHCTEEQILITAGLQYSLEIVCKLFPNGGSYAMEEPGYPGASSVFYNNGITTRGIPIDNQGMLVTYLNQYDNIRMVYVTPSHQFPTGFVMTLKRRYELLEWANRNNAFILEDDYDNEYRYDMPLLPSLQSIDKHDRVIYFGSFSKSLSPSVRISYLVLPKQLLTLYKTKFEFYNCTVPLLDQYILSQLIKHQHYSRMIRISRHHFSMIHNTFLETFQRHIKDVHILNPRSGLYYILEFPPSIDIHQIIQKADALHVKVYSMEQYWFTSPNFPKNQLFIGFSNISMEQIEDCVMLLKKAFTPPY